MKKSSFQTLVCKQIAANAVKGAMREMLLELAVNGECAPVVKQSRAYNDKTEYIERWLLANGIEASVPSKAGSFFRSGWYLVNIAPRGGKPGNRIKIIFDR